MPVLDDNYKNTEEYLQFIRANEDPRAQQELFDLMRLER